MGVSGGDHNHNSNYYYYTDSGSSPQKWDDNNYVDKGEYTINTGEWTYDGISVEPEMYIDGVPVNQRIKELQDCIKMLHGILKRKFAVVANDSVLNEMVENLTSEKQEVADAHTHEQPLKDELFEI